MKLPSLPCSPLPVIVFLTTAAFAPIHTTSRATESGPVIDKVRLYPRDGFGESFRNGRITASNTSPTNDFEAILTLKEGLPEGRWSEFPIENDRVFRYVKFEASLGSRGNIAEIEFYAGGKRVEGAIFGTQGSFQNNGNVFGRAMDGDTATFFEGPEPANQYVGIDVGESFQTKPVTMSPPPGAYETAQSVAMSSDTPGAEIRYGFGGSRVNSREGRVYDGEVRVAQSTVLIAVASAHGLADSVPVIGAYRIGAKSMATSIRSFHIGNSLTDTIDGWLKPVAESAGFDWDFRRFTIPGAPTDWLWEHPGSGFGDSRYLEAFDALAPIDHISTQPFAGHDRSVANESEYSKRFFDACRAHSPDVQAWLYVQWPPKNFDDRWSRATGSTEGMGLTPATTWEEGAMNHVKYTEAVQETINATYAGKPVLIVPAGAVLAECKRRMDAGKFPGISDFFAATFSDDVHLAPTGRYAVALTFASCLTKQPLKGKVSPLTTDLSPEQVDALCEIVWEVVSAYPESGVR